MTSGARPRRARPRAAVRRQGERRIDGRGGEGEIGGVDEQPRSPAATQTEPQRVGGLQSKSGTERVKFGKRSL